MIIKYGSQYDKIVDAMNEVFGWSYKACFKGFYYLNSSRSCGAWFPKLANSDNGKQIPGDKWKGWINTISDDGTHIYMINKEDPKMMSAIDPDYPVHLTFAKKAGAGEKYVFIGAYKISHIDPNLGYVFDRLDTDVDTYKYGV